MFHQLPSEATETKTSVVNVGIDDLEIVTDTLVKVSGPNWFMKIAKGTRNLHSQVPQTILRTATEQKKFAEQDFVQKYTSWTSPAYDEQDWSKVQEMRTRELLNERAKVASLCETSKCLECPSFLKHVSTLCDTGGRNLLTMYSLLNSTTNG